MRLTLLLLSCIFSVGIAKQVNLGSVQILSNLNETVGQPHDVKNRSGLIVPGGLITNADNQRRREVGSGSVGEMIYGFLLVGNYDVSDHLKA